MSDQNSSESASYPSARRADYPAFYETRTRWRDNDVYGHMNNVVYYEYFDTAVNDWLIASGALAVPDGPVVGLVAETSCRYLKSVGFPERIIVGLAAQRVGRTSVVYGLGLFSGEDEEAAAVCRYVHVYVDAASRRPTDLPAPMRAALGELTR